MKNLNKKNFTLYIVDKFQTKRNFIKNNYVQRTNLLLIILGFVLMTQYGIGQQSNIVSKGNFGLSVSGMICADGYGTQYLPTLYYKKNRSCFFAGSIIQKKKANLSGVQLNYEYTLVKEDDAYSGRLELFCFATGLYQNKAILGKQTLHEESVANPEFNENMCEIHFKTMEVYGGFGLRIKLFKNVKWTNSIGGGGYTSFNSPCNLYYATHNFGLILKTGISIDLKN